MIPKTLNNWLQPHEGVAGEERPDDPVLTMTPAAKKVLATVVYRLYGETLMGTGQSPKTRELYTRMKTPQVGDYVIVGDILSGWMTRNDPELDHFRKGVGLFLGDRREWWTTDEEWERELRDGERYEDDERSTDHAWYVQYLTDGSVCRWVNCELLAIPDSAH